MIALRGYDTSQVDQLLDQADRAIASGGAIERAAARDALRDVRLDRRFRGYARREVELAVEERFQQLG